MNVERETLPSIGLPVPIEALPNIQSPLTSALWTVYNIFHHVRYFWRYFRQAEAALDANNIPWIAVGTVVDWTVGDHKIVCLTAQIAAIAARLVLVKKKWKQLRDEVEALSLACSKEFNPPPVPLQPLNHNEGAWRVLPISFTTSLQRDARKLIYRIEAIFRHTLLLSLHFFVLTMRIFDLYEAILLQPDTEIGSRDLGEMKREFFVNIKRIDDGFDLTETIEENEEEIRQVLRLISSHESYDDLLNTARNVQEAYRAVTVGVSPVLDGIAGAVKTTARFIRSRYHRIRNSMA